MAARLFPFGESPSIALCSTAECRRTREAHLARVARYGSSVLRESSALDRSTERLARSTMADDEEAEWIRRAQAGDRTAFGRLVRRHQRRIQACASHMLGNRAEAEDAVQETFLRAFRAIDRFDGRAELSTWLYRICINVSLNALRRRRRTGARELDDPRLPEPASDPGQTQSDPRRALEGAEVYTRLAQAIDELSPSLKATVVLVLLEGLPQKEAAEVLGCSEGTVAWRVHESRRRLRERLVDLLDEETSLRPERPLRPGRSA